jgi:hypothetical protein
LYESLPSTSRGRDIDRCDHPINHLHRIADRLRRAVGEPLCAKFARDPWVGDYFGADFVRLFAQRHPPSASRSLRAVTTSRGEALRSTREVEITKIVRFIELPLIA